jgi:hypothetical protein
MQLLQKENILIIVALLCIILYFKGQQISDDKKVQEWLELLPTIGGIAYGFNTLFKLAQ